jgi:predicted aspartyl protease
MPCLSGKFDPNIGPLINISVLAAGVLTSSFSGNIATLPALIDTGTSVTCIPQNVAQAVPLQPIGLRPMVSATHSVPVNVYIVDLSLTFGAAGFVIQGTQVMEFIPEGNASLQMLLGRDVICKGVLTLSFDGHFTFSL